jgi:electron transport complex protein RnfG
MLAELKTKLSYQASLLAIVALLASAILGYANKETHEVIKQRLAEDLKSSLEEVIPANYYDNDLLQDTLNLVNQKGTDTKIYLARKDGKVTAVAFMQIATGGYSGDISLMLGIDKDGNILGVRTIAHAETPGLGDKIEVKKSNWILSFNNYSLENLTEKQWCVKKDGGIFDAFSGATITPRAVVKAVHLGLAFFKAHQAELISIK